MSGPQRYPLAWPPHRPRTPSSRRKAGVFKADKRPITMAVAFGRLEDEVRRLGAVYPLLSTNVELRLDGGPRSGQRAPADPGACVYFSLGGKPFALACDTYTTVEQNVAALAAHIDSTRAIERHGVASAAETLEAFVALPAPKTWWQVLELTPDATREQITAAFRRMAARAHPDQGGSDAAMAELNAARDAALRECKS